MDRSQFPCTTAALHHEMKFGSVDVKVYTPMRPATAGLAPRSRERRG